MSALIWRINCVCSRLEGRSGGIEIKHSFVVRGLIWALKFRDPAEQRERERKRARRRNWSCATRATNLNSSLSRRAHDLAESSLIDAAALWERSNWPSITVDSPTASVASLQATCNSYFSTRSRSRPELGSDCAKRALASSLAAKANNNNDNDDYYEDKARDCWPTTASRASRSRRG